MEFPIKRQLTLLLIWIVVVIPGLFFAYMYFPSRELDWLNILILFAILFVTMLLPLQVKEVDVPLDKWVILTVFLQYGVWAELVFVQLAILVLVLTNKSTTPKLYRFLFNSLIFVIISIMSGLVFHLAGGQIGSVEFKSVIFYALLYAATYSFLNNVLLKFYFHVNNQKFSLVSEGAIADYTATFMLLPFALSVYLLHEYIGNLSLLLLGVPFIVLLAVSRTYTKSNNLNEILANASEIGHQLTEQHRFDEVVASFIENLKEVIPYQNAYVIDMKNEEHMYFLMSYENGAIHELSEQITVNNKYRLVDGLDKDATKIYDNEKELHQLKALQLFDSSESVLTVPVKRGDETEGFIILTSKRRNLFQSLDIKIMAILSGYFMISLDKAIHFEETLNASERCALTKLYNFNYLEKKLEEQVIQYHMGEIEMISLILLDIDHFKLVNDTYGHGNGNIVLVELAKLLKKHTEINDTVARYGGEEFVFVIANGTKEEATRRAEKIRKEVEETAFTIYPDLSDDQAPIDIHITISLGVATLPEDAISVQELFRNTDRALYIGGKQAGRNKVGIFEKEIISVN